MSNWDVSRVNNMARMFCSAYSFNGDISKWDVSSLADTSDMFCLGCCSVQQRNLEMGYVKCEISKWDVSSAKSRNGMCQVATSLFSGGKAMTHHDNLHARQHVNDHHFNCRCDPHQHLDLTLLPLSLRYSIVLGRHLEVGCINSAEYGWHVLGCYVV